jgi:3-hydroxyisobutyrate dehydrogenase-like beta-hydroxyacid dehydrogenase
MSEVKVGLLHLGEMGSSVGAAARTGGARVSWASEGRSDATRRRAKETGIEDAVELEGLVEGNEILLSVCPPHAARAQAETVARLGFRGLYVDANAVSPDTSREICRIVEKSGGAFVDGGIIGPPSRSPGSTRLYLSGEEAARVGALFEGSALEAIVIGGPPGAASALKVCFASYTKGTAALLAAIRALALHEGVDDALVREWERSIPELPGRSEAGARANARKAWRFVGEMEEIAAAFSSAGLPDGFHRAAAEIYARLDRYRGASDAPTLDEVARALLRRD